MTDANFVMGHPAFKTIALGSDEQWTLVLVFDGTVSSMRGRTTAVVLEAARYVIEHHDRAHGLDREAAA